MASIERGKINIPYFITHGPPKVGNDSPHIPSRNNSDGPIAGKINAALQIKDPPPLIVGNFADIPLPPVSPHSNDHMVHWLPEIEYIDGKPILKKWENPASMEKIIKSDFLTAFQDQIFKLVEDGSPFYMQFGYSKFNNSPPKGFTKAGPQTIYRLHGHLTSRIYPLDIDGHMRIFEGMSDEEFRHVSLFFDFGAQLARKHIAQAKDFSSFEHTWTQMDGMVERTAYGFLSIKDALSQLLSTFTSLSKDKRWTTIATELYDKYAKDYTVKVGSEDKSLLLFSPVPGGALFTPTPEERELMGLPSNCPYKVFVSLFSPIMKPQIVNGLYIYRR